jgi:hypothetical protein
MHKSTSRSEKVELIKGLLSGQKSLRGAKPHRVFMWYHLDECYSLEDGSLKLSESDFKAYCQGLNCNAHHVIIEDYTAGLKPPIA